MYKKLPLHTTSFRFRRWSRAGYAIFRSLSCNVTIGKVCSSICDMSFQKSGTLSQGQAFTTLFSDDRKEQGNDPEEELLFKQIQLEQILNIQIAQQLSVVAVASQRNTFINIVYNPGGWNKIILFQPLFLYPL